MENGLHYRRDVPLRKDAGLVRWRNAPQVTRTLNNTAVKLILQQCRQSLATAQRCFAYIFVRRWQPFVLPDLC